jgi:hypothetical protein
VNRYADDVTLQNMKTTIAVAWTLSVCVVALTANVTSVSAWTVLIALGVLPPVALLRLWNAPAQTMSESISEARR